MAIPNKHKKVVGLAAYTKKRFTYYVNPEPEFLLPGDIEELIKQGRYLGTYTRPEPYILQKEDDKDADR